MMIYSQLQERGNRLKLVLKIGFPFLLLICIYYVATKFYDLGGKDLVLLTVLAIIYIYYIFYVIYTGFKTTLIDNVTKTFSRDYMFELMNSWRCKYPKSSVVMLKVSNIEDINDRYGVISGDKVLTDMCVSLYKFLEEKKYEKVPIGRYGGGYFLVLVNEQESTLKHFFSIFQKSMKSKGIDDIEVKIDVTMTSINYDKRKDNIINHLLNNLENEQNPLLAKPDIYDKLVCESVEKEDFTFSYQPMLDLKSKRIKIYEILVKLNVEGFGTISNDQIRTVINRNGYEREFDEGIINALTKNISHLNIDVLLCLHVSPVVLRSSKFKSFITKKINDNELDPSRFLFTFTEKNVYDEMARFEEILSSYKKMGFRFALNHFGGDNATLEYIKWLPIDYASFDLEYTKYLKKHIYHEILQSHITLLKTLNITSIAKFIETPYVYESLKKMGIDMLQGYMIGKPKPIRHKESDDNAIID